MTPMPHPPYSPPLTPNNLFCCLRMKKVLKRKHLTDVEEVGQKMPESLKGIKINKFKNCFEQRKKHLSRYIASNAKYFEDD